MGKILDFIGGREKVVEKKRRRFERILFRNFLGTYSVVRGGEGIYPVDLVDISPEGCLFQIPAKDAKAGLFAAGSEVTLRVYFTEFDYISVVATIRHSGRHLSEDGVYRQRYGCQFERSMASFKAMAAFIDFLYRFAECASVDRGDEKIRIV